MMKSIRFSLEAPGAREVILAGDFTDWQAHARKMRRVGRGGAFAARVPLAPGRYEYKFIVDGQWLHDPRAESVPNSFGTNNSIVTVSD